MPKKPEIERAEAIAACPGHRWVLRFSGSEPPEIYCHREECPATVDDLYLDSIDATGGLLPVTLDAQGHRISAGPWGPEEYDFAIEVSPRDLTDENPTTLSAPQLMARAWLIWDQMTPDQRTRFVANLCVTGGFTHPIGSGLWAGMLNALSQIT